MMIFAAIPTPNLSNWLRIMAKARVSGLTPADCHSGYSIPIVLIAFDSRDLPIAQPSGE